VRAAVPIARVIYIEPDIFDPDHRAEAESSLGAAAESSARPAGPVSAAASTQGGPGGVAPVAGDRH